MIVHSLVLIAIVSITALVMHHKQMINITNGGIAMAFGILGLAIVNQYPSFSVMFSTVSFVLIILLISRYLADYLTYRSEFISEHFNDPVNGFAAGTWIAGISISFNLVFKGLEGLEFISFPIYMVNVILWIFYIGLAGRFYLKLLRQRTQLMKVHGVILLSCVATQSLVVSGKSFFKEQFPDGLGIGLLGFGLILYLIGILFITAVIIKKSNYSLEKDWTTANCMIHGALSITGVAAVKLAAVPVYVTAIIWMLVLLLFILVEGIEILRGRVRIKNRGWHQGVFTYYPDQWARNFTFGMFYYFTVQFTFKESFSG